jgi:hypothetical protein
MSASHDLNARHELHALEQDPQIVVSVEFLGRGLCQACIGDITHGYREIGKLESFNAAVEWLQEKARQNYPDSKYVQHLPELKR